METFGSWSVLTAGFLIILYLALGGVTFCSLLQLTNAKWRVHVRKLASALAGLFPIAFGLLLILLFNGESTFQWLQHDGHAGEEPLPGWHNYNFLMTREILGLLIVAGLFGLFIKLQNQSEEDSSYAVQRRFRNVALLIPFAYVSYTSMVAWDFEMTMMPGWHSSVYAPYHFVSNFHAFLAFFTVLLYFLSRSGRLNNPLPPYVLNYMAQLMFAFTILWTYLFFVQYLIFWYGRFPHDTHRYVNMLYEGYAPLWWTFFSLKFIIPFCTFLFTENRHNPVVITIIGVGIFLGTCLERYTWISGSVSPEFYHFPVTTLFEVFVITALIIIVGFTLRWSLIRSGLLQSRSTASTGLQERAR